MEFIVQTLNLHKKLNQIIFESLFQLYQTQDILKFKDSYSFCVVHPDDPSGNFYLLISNYPDEDGFVQTQFIDENLTTSVNFKIIRNFEHLIKEIERFLKEKIEKQIDPGTNSTDFLDETDSNEDNLNNKLEYISFNDI